MKYLKTIQELNESKSTDEEEVDFEMEISKKLDSVACYFEEDQPISKEDGFVECFFLYDYNSEDNFSNEIPVGICFYFKDYIDEEKLEIFYEYLKSKNLEVKENNFGSDSIEFTVEVPIDLVNEYAEIYDATKKYNL